MFGTTYLSDRLCVHFLEEFQKYGLLEQVDAETIEEALLGREKVLNSSKWSSFGMATTSATVLTAGAALLLRFWSGSAATAALFGSALVGTLAYRKARRYFDCRRHLGSVTKALKGLHLAVRRRHAVAFSVGINIKVHSTPLAVQLRLLAVEVIRCLDSASTQLASRLSEEDTDRLLSNFYSEGICEILEQNVEDHGETGERVVETLLDLTYLHVSEYCQLKERCLNVKLSSKQVETRKNESLIPVSSLTKVAFALEDVVQGIASGELEEQEVGDALRRIAQLIEIPVSGKIPKSEAENVTAELSTAIPEAPAHPAPVFERTDVDMVFEGVPDQDEPSTIDRNFHDTDFDNAPANASLIGELQFALLDRRDDFARREKAARAKFYGVSEAELDEIDKREANEDVEKEKEETNYEGTGEGGEPDVVTSWRDAISTTCGVHQQINDDAFLAALASRRIPQSHIGDDSEEESDEGS
ncbi:unnamed protein product [Caenorhabditis auriculariae]|uniref:Vezatin n=1 Tax=Caenorhabditis auriculariae TaxID=2777116 RepID=A0A8S1HEM5_9PELO|nr:unnamed protein product [Caenorhabditis auriculariae]